MKQLIPIAMLITLGMSCPVIAADDAAATPQTTVDNKEFDQQMSQMQDLMKQMQEQMRNIDASKNTAERQKLLAQHWDSMHQGMQMMHKMWNAGMMNCCMGAGMTPEQMAKHQQMMNQYMGMQQMMMQHMWGHQGWMMGPHGQR
ncbi:MAG: hypothetical protein U1F34_03870 [Gammaproteobacteria bacterium]